MERVPIILHLNPALDTFLHTTRNIYIKTESLENLVMKAGSRGGLSTNIPLFLFPSDKSESLGKSGALSPVPTRDNIR